MYKQIGDPYNLTFASADATTAAALVLTDHNGVPHTLAANEILIIDSINCFTALTGTNRVEIFHDVDGAGDVDPSELIASFGVGNGGTGFPGDGYSCKTGLTPQVVASAAGKVNITGVGRVINGGGPTGRPSWKEAEVGR